MFMRVNSKCARQVRPQPRRMTGAQSSITLDHYRSWPLPVQRIERGTQLH
jgi:hypothetical protein